MKTRLSSTFFLLLLVLGHVWFVSGCGNASVVAGENPIHYHMVCVSRADTQTEPCGPESLSFFNLWVKEAISLPHSSFSIWTVDSARQQYHPGLTVCVPTHWKVPVLKNKADFITRARQAVTATQQGQTEQDDCHLPKSHAPGIHQLMVSPAEALPLDLVEQLASASPAPPLNQGLVCDVSASTLGMACNATSLLRAFDFWVAEGLARPGSSLSVAVVGPSRDTMRTVFDLSVPDRSLGERLAFLLVAREQLARLPGESFEENASAIVEAIHAVVSTLRERQGSYVLIVESDLRQLSAEWDFDATVPEASTFLAWLKKTHLLPDLRNVTVRVCGLHTHRSPGRGPYTAKRAAQLQELWQRMFREAGTSEVKLFSSCEVGFAA